jgi:hypothetical protein
MSANRGSSLAKIEFMVEHEFGVASGDKKVLFELMDKDLFLYPTVRRVSVHYPSPIDAKCADIIGWICRSQATISVSVYSAPPSRSFCSSRRKRLV